MTKSAFLHLLLNRGWRFLIERNALDKELYASLWVEEGMGHLQQLAEELNLTLLRDEEERVWKCYWPHKEARQHFCVNVDDEFDIAQIVLF